MLIALSSDRIGASANEEVVERRLSLHDLEEAALEVANEDLDDLGGQWGGASDDDSEAGGDEDAEEPPNRSDDNGEASNDEGAERAPSPSDDCDNGEVSDEEGRAGRIPSLSGEEDEEYDSQ
jgi:hypothetical protein